MHKNVRKFCQSIKLQFPMHFVGVDVLDCGSLDINGNNRYLFDNSRYLGIDIVKGNNVDLVTKVHEYTPTKKFDCVISTEMLEHDMFFKYSLQSMSQFTKPGGLLLLTAAGYGREEHGTHNHHPNNSPLTHDYYRNVDVQMLSEALDFTQFFWFTIIYIKTDIQFAGVKKL